MRTKFTSIILFIYFVFSFFNETIGQSIFTNPITGTNPNTSNPYTTGQTVNANISVSGIGRGPGITGTNANDRYNANSWDGASFDANQYFEFTLTPNAGYEIDFTSFVYTSQISSGSINLVFRSSVDGYVANIGTPVSGGTTISLSGAVYQNITTPISFRLYGWGTPAGTTTFSVNSFTFNGAVTLAPTCSAPTVQASAFSTSSITASTATLSWTRGDGNNVLVVARAGSAVNQDPTNGTSYTDNSVFGSGTQIGTGNYVVYSGTGTSVAISGLLSGTTYHVAFYEYNTLGNCYMLAELTGNFSTTCSAPSIQASTIVVTSGSNNAAISWTNGNGVERVVKLNTVNSFTDPINGTSPTANTVYSGFGEQVIYNGTGNSVTVSGLAVTTMYYVRVYEANCSGVNTVYNTSTATNNPNSFTTTAISAGTVLNPGDIAIIGYDAQVYGSGSEDLIAFVNTVDLAVGTSFIMTDNGFELVSSPNVRDYTFGNGEGAISLTWNGPGVLPKGTVTEYRTDVVPLGWTRTCVSDRNGASVGGCDPTALNFSTAGDQLFILQGTWNEGTYTCSGSYYGPGETGCANATFSGRYIFGFNGIGGGWVSTTASPIVVNTDGARRSRLPRELRCFNAEFTTTVDRRQYSDASFDNGTQRQIVGNIKNISNWTSFATGAFSLGNFTVGSGWTSGQWVGDINTNWFDCANWDNLLVPDATTDVVLSTSSIADADVDATASFSDEFQDIALCKNLTINNRKLTLEGSANDKIEVHGNITLNTADGLDMSDGSNGTPDGQLYLFGNWLNLVEETQFKQGESTVHLLGNGDQTITSDLDDNETFYNLVINKPSGVVNLTGDDDITIEGTMNFTLGIVNSDNSSGSHVIFANAGISSGASVNSFVNGPVQKFTNSTTLFTFPVGDVNGVNLFRPLGLLPSTISSSVFEAEYTGTGYSNYTYGSGITDVSEKEWWRLDKNSGSANATVTLTWGAESDIPNELTNSVNSLKVAHFNGIDWNNHNGNNHMGTITAGQVTSDPVTVYGAFTLGVEAPLPIQLLSLAVSSEDAYATVQWLTSSEINIKGFEVQISENGIDFYTIGFAKANGALYSYSFVTPIENGKDYYFRLKIIDNDGTIEYSKAVYMKVQATSSIYLYPNPTSSYIHLHTPNAEMLVSCSLVMINSIGEEVLIFSGIFEDIEKRINQSIPSFAQGVYFIKLFFNNEKHTLKLVKE